MSPSHTGDQHAPTPFCTPQSQLHSKSSEGSTASQQVHDLNVRIVNLSTDVHNCRNEVRGSPGSRSGLQRPAGLAQGPHACSASPQAGSSSMAC